MNKQFFIQRVISKTIITRSVLHKDTLIEIEKTDMRIKLGQEILGYLDEKRIVDIHLRYRTKTFYNDDGDLYIVLSAELSKFKMDD